MNKQLGLHSLWGHALIHRVVLVNCIPHQMGWELPTLHAVLPINSASLGWHHCRSGHGLLNEVVATLQLQLCLGNDSSRLRRV